MLKEKQFVEIEFTGRVKETGEIFDTTNAKDAKAIGIEDVKPLKICIGEKMLPEKFDLFLVGKDLGKEYSIELSPKDAFGERKKELVKIIPLRIFAEKGVMPQKGMLLNLDGLLVKVISVSGGRVIADFNNPLAGKNVAYNFKINKVIEDKKESLEVLIQSLGIDTSKASIELKDKKALVDLKNDKISIPKKMAEKLSEKARNLLNIDVELKK